MDPIILNIATLAGITIGIGTVIDKAFTFPDRWTPLLDLVVSMALALIFLGLSKQFALVGLIAGLTASGTYTGAQVVGAKIVAATSANTSAKQ